MDQFGIKDALDILLCAAMLFYLYKMMKESGSLNIFIGLISFFIVWVVASEILEMRLIGSILDKFMSIGLIIIVILFQEQLKRVLVDIGSHRRWRYFKHLFSHKTEESKTKDWVMPLVYACVSMSKTKTGALIVIQGKNSLHKYERLGDTIDAAINPRLVENIFFKNSPLHDGAMIIAGNRICAAGCVLPVSHDASLPRHLGLRHRSALGISQATDALAITVSEETGNISVAHKGKLYEKISMSQLEHYINEA